jgi:hypothetical protein
MNKRFCLVSLLMLAAPGMGHAQDIDSVIGQSAPVAFFRTLGDKLTGNSPAPAAIEQPQVDDSPAVAFERGPARPDEVLSPRSQAMMSKRDAFGAPETPTICSNCAD